MVRLLRNSSLQTRLSLCGFNSSMVRLLPDRNAETQNAQLFQFLNGTIITISHCDRHAPKMVSIPQWYDYYFITRLPDVNFIRFQFLNGTIITFYPLSAEAHKNKFQFLNGTIITGKPESCADWVNRFQFLNGTIITSNFPTQTSCEDVSIPQWYDYYLFNAPITASLFCFNSSMVRLLLLLHHRYLLHKLRFNSSMVRLLRTNAIITISSSSVSIPQWYDYYIAFRGLCRARLRFQFLNGTIITLYAGYY